MSTKKDWQSIFSLVDKDPKESFNSWFRKLAVVASGETVMSLKTAWGRHGDDTGFAADISNGFEKRNADGSIQIQDIVSSKLTDAQIFERYGRSPKEWRVSMVWFKDKPNGTYIMSCCFIPLVQAKLWNFEEIKNDMKKHAPKYKPVKYNRDNKEPVMLEISIYDLHYAKLCWAEETGGDYDTKIAEKRFNDALDDLLSRASIYNVEKILFVFGNDFFNSEGKSNATTEGTPQDTDSRWQKMFTGGRKLLVSGIEKMMQIAPVDAIGIYGNHANQAEFYLGDALECWFHNCKQVNINNNPTARKYYQYGNSLIGFTHGNLERENDLPLLMASEEPELWAQAKFREFHRGDKHHERVKVFNTSVENKTVVLRTLCSMSGTDAWHKGKGYVGQRQAANSFTWSKYNGLRDICYHNVK